MKKLFIKTGVFVLTFFVTMIVAGQFMNRGNHDMTMAMGEASLPVITFFQGEESVNELHGHTVKMDVSSMAGNLIQLGENREIGFEIKRYGSRISEIVLEIRSRDGQRLIEQAQITEYAENGDSIWVETTLKDLLEKDTEYAVVVVLTHEDGREIRYYTGCIWGMEMYAEEKAAFVREFHEMTFDKEKAVELKKYLESNSSGDNTTLHKVNIHSSFAQVTWGELQVSPETEPMVEILELGRDTGSFALRTYVSTSSEKEKTYYEVEEFYRIRYTKDRVYLLDFERTMIQLPNIEGNIYANDKIYLGITGTDIQLAESSDGNFLVFEAGDRLCSYQVKENKLSLLFSFYDQENRDIRTLYNAHEMKILNMDEAGNVTFAVYGYFNRGRHEGETGICVYAFDNGLNTIEELVYIPYEKSWEVLFCDVEKLLYLNGNQKLYVYLDQSVYEVDISAKTAAELVSIKEDEVLHTSPAHRIVLWTQEDSLHVLDLEEEENTKISVAAGERAQALGFMGADIIYGVVREKDVVKDASGKEIRPMYRVIICDTKGNVLKRYEEEDIYTRSVEIVDNQITLNRIKAGSDGMYVDTIPEHIVNNAEQAAGKNKLVTTAVDVYETITQIQVKSNIDTKSIQIRTPKEVVFEGSREVFIENRESEQKRYYVYNQNDVDEIYFNPASAIRLAYDTSGRVVDETGNTVWFKGNRVTKNQIMAITEPEKVSSEQSLSVCLDTILKLEGITAQTASMLEQGQEAEEILKEYLVNAEVADLTGCDMDAVLYFVNKDIPVLAILEDGEGVLITGFNEFNIVIFEPATGRLYKKGLKDSAAWFEENGNFFITYFEKN